MTSIIKDEVELQDEVRKQYIKEKIAFLIEDMKLTDLRIPTDDKCSWYIDDNGIYYRFDHRSGEFNETNYNLSGGS